MGRCTLPLIFSAILVGAALAAPEPPPTEFLINQNAQRVVLPLEDGTERSISSLLRPNGLIIAVLPRDLEAQDDARTYIVDTLREWRSQGIAPGVNVIGLQVQPDALSDLESTTPVAAAIDNDTPAATEPVAEVEDGAPVQPDPTGDPRNYTTTTPADDALIFPIHRITESALTRLIGTGAMEKHEATTTFYLLFDAEGDYGGVMISLDQLGEMYTDPEGQRPVTNSNPGGVASPTPSAN